MWSGLELVGSLRGQAEWGQTRKPWDALNTNSAPGSARGRDAPRQIPPGGKVWPLSCEECGQGTASSCQLLPGASQLLLRAAYEGQARGQAFAQGGLRPETEPWGNVKGRTVLSDVSLSRGNLCPEQPAGLAQP